jgi:hypothetical protein
MRTHTNKQIGDSNRGFQGGGGALTAAKRFLKHHQFALNFKH